MEDRPRRGRTSLPSRRAISSSNSPHLLFKGFHKNCLTTFPGLFSLSMVCAYWHILVVNHPCGGSNDLENEKHRGSQFRSWCNYICTLILYPICVKITQWV